MHKEDEDLERLRQLLLQPEMDTIEEINKRINDPSQLADKVAKSLPKAVRMGDRDGGALSTALLPVIEKVMRKSVKQNPDLLIEVLFPIIGSAVRKAVTEMFEKMIQAVNQTLATNMSWRSVSWRFKAWRTGKSYSEIVLYHTLVYRVEQIFLIEKETGLLIQHMAVDTTMGTDSDLISSMLSAIQDFVKDSFQVNNSTPLEELKLDEFNVWIEAGSLTTLALVIRGNVPRELRDTMRSVLKEFEECYDQDLENFNGDPESFTQAQPLLAECFDSKAKEEDSPKGFWLIAAIICCLGLIFGGFQVKDYLTLTKIKETLMEEPGIWVTKVTIEDDTYAVHGLKDPLARSFDQVLSNPKLPVLKDATMPIISMEPELVKRRIHKLLVPPDSVSLKIQKTTLYISGEAEQGWIERTKRFSGVLPGIEHINVDALSDASIKFLKQQIYHLHQLSIHFEVSKVDIPIENQAALHRAASIIRQSHQEAITLGKQMIVLVKGYSDSSGGSTINQKISQQRADFVRTGLIKNGVSPQILVAKGMGEAEQGAQEQTSQRKVILEVKLK